MDAVKENPSQGEWKEARNPQGRRKRPRFSFIHCGLLNTLQHERKQLRYCQHGVDLIVHQGL